MLVIIAQKQCVFILLWNEYYLQLLSNSCQTNWNAIKDEQKYQPLLPCLQTIRVSDQDSRTVIGRTRHVTSPIWSRIDWLTGPKIRIVGLSFAELEMDKTVHSEFYLPLSGRSKHHFHRTFKVYDSWKIKFNLHGPCSKVSLHEDSASEFSRVGSIFFNEVVGICK